MDISSNGPTLDQLQSFADVDYALMLELLNMYTTSRPTDSSSPNTSPRIVALKRHRNNLASIYRLPDECLVQILLLTMDPFAWNIKRLQELASVSKLWRDTICCSPTLWSALDVDAGDAVVEMVLHKNPAAPLDVHADNHFENKVSPFLLKAAESMSRWRIFEVKSSNLKTNVRDLFLEVTEELPLRYFDVGWGCIHFPWTRHPFTKLEVLCLRGLLAQELNSTTVINALTRCPLLRKLVLSFTEPVHWEHLDWDSELEIQDDQPVAHLPFLSTLIIHSSTKGLSSGLLLGLDAPNCRCVSLFRVHPALFDPRALPLSSSFLNMIAGPVKACESLNISYSNTPSDLNISGGYPNESQTRSFVPCERPGIFLRVTYVRRTHWNDIAAWLHRTTSVPVGLELYYTLQLAFLQENWSMADPMEPTQIFDDFPAAVSLFVSCYDLPPIFDALRVPRRDSTGVSRWYLPKLINLSVAWHIGGSAEVLWKPISSMMRARTGLEPPPDNAELPVKLRGASLPRPVRKLAQKRREFSGVTFYSKGDRWGIKGRLAHGMRATSEWWNNIIYSPHWPFN